MTAIPTAISGDTVIEAIRVGSINQENISYQLIRRLAGWECGCWRELDRGRANLTTIDQLDQYLYSYGPMTKEQWDQVFPSMRIPTGKLQIIDYGCGQGLASAMLFDHFGADVAKQASRLVLVERSGVALTRAESILSCYAPNADVRAVNKCLDDLTVQDLKPNGTSHFIHLFSNVLDIKSFDHVDLLGKILKTRGNHTILCVSHNRSFHGGSSRFHDIVQAIDNHAHNGRMSVKESTICEFRCPRGMEAISLQLCLEVHHESV